MFRNFVSLSRVVIANSTYVHLYLGTIGYKWEKQKHAEIYFIFKRKRNDTQEDSTINESTLVDEVTPIGQSIHVGHN